MKEKISSKPFLILTPGRSGSEHLVETLNNFSDLDVRGELFNRTNKTFDSFYYYCRSNLLFKTLGYFSNREKISSNSLNLPLKFLVGKYLSQLGAENEQITGFKLTLDQWAAYPIALTHLIERKSKFIYLKRENTLLQVLSLLKARKTNEYHHQSDQYTKPLNFDPVVVKSEIQNQLKLEIQLLQKLKNYDCYIITYESLFENYQEHVNSIRSFLKLPKQPIRHYSNLKKVNPKNPRKWVENYDELEMELGSLLGKLKH